MASKNGSKELISLLQYMKDTRLDNPEIKVKDERLIELDRIVSEVKESEEESRLAFVSVSRELEAALLPLLPCASSGLVLSIIVVLVLVALS